MPFASAETTPSVESNITSPVSKKILKYDLPPFNKLCFFLFINTHHLLRNFSPHHNNEFLPEFGNTEQTVYHVANFLACAEVSKIPHLFVLNTKLHWDTGCPSGNTPSNIFPSLLKSSPSFPIYSQGRSWQISCILLHSWPRSRVISLIRLIPFFTSPIYLTSDPTLHLLAGSGGRLLKLVHDYSKHRHRDAGRYRSNRMERFKFS